MKSLGIDVLRVLEREYSVKVLFGVESGSRSWGFASENSDFDIRGVFYYPEDTYLGVLPFKDQIPENRESGSLEFVIKHFPNQKVDPECWEIHKFAKLMLASNPAVFEWLNSDVVYIDSEHRSKLKQMFIKGCSLYALKKHYVSMAQRTYLKYIQGKEEVNSKKYRYILRSLGCINYIVERETTPPSDYKGILPFLPEPAADFLELVVDQAKNIEAAVIVPNVVIDQFIENQLKQKFEADTHHFDKQAINDLIIDIIRKA